jgi:hypothetical protein
MRCLRHRYNRATINPSFMRSATFPLLLAGSLAALLAPAALQAQPTLVCPTTTAGRPCDAFHYHVQMYRPDTKQFVDIPGGNQFATQPACERARDLQVAANTKVVEYFRGVREQQYEADRIGPCHCDMTMDRSAPNYLTDVQRTAQLRQAEEVRLRVREKLLDNKLTSESEIIRGLWSEPPLTPLLGGPRLVPPPQSAAAAILTATEDLKLTRTIDTSKPAPAAMDLPLVDIAASLAASPGAAPAAAPAEGSMASAPAPTPAATTPTPEPPAEEVVVAAPATPEPAPADAPVASTVPEEDIVSAEETAERFVTYETQRIQNVIRAASAIADENVKSKIFEACTQRIQLLSNLRLLIEGSGMRSRLATAARDAQGEDQRLALIARLFGENVRPHWAPKDAADVVFDIEPEIVAAPENVLRDTTGRVSTEQKKHALYLVLAQTQPTEDQRLWLSTVVEGFFR